MAKMYRPQEYIHYCALFLILSPLLIDQVSSMKCYECNSDTENELACITDSKLEPFGVECKPGAGFTSAAVTENAAVMQYKCVTIKGFAFSDGRNVIDRRCVQKFMTCDTIKTVVASIPQDASVLKEPIQVEDCKLCETDLCNSSGHLKAGIWSLMLSLLAVCLIKF